MSMDIENQVCTLEQAKKLKELGVVQESLFDWTIEHKKKDYNETSTQLMGGTFDVRVNHDINWRTWDFNKRETYSAFTVSELGAMLPDADKMEDKLEPLFIEKYGECDKERFNKYFRSLFNAQDICEWVIYLLENNHITASEVNNRLTTK